MPLKFKVKSLDEVPEAARSFYTEGEGGFSLAVDGVVPKEKLTEFRDNNVALKRQVDEYTTKFGGIDPDKARELLAKQQQIEEKQLIEAGDVDAIVEKRIGTMAKEHQKALSTLSAERDGLQQQLHTHLVHGEVRTEALKSGILPSALDDVILRADRVFKAQDGRPAAFKGAEPLYGKDGVTPMRPAEWLESLRTEAPHLFAPSTGTGAKPGVSGGAAPAGPSVAGTVRASELRENPGKYREAIMKKELRIVPG